MSPTISSGRLVGQLTRRDLTRNVGTWRIPLASSVLFAFLFVNGAFVASLGQDRAESLFYAVAIDGDLDGATGFLADLEDTRFTLKPESETGEPAAQMVNGERASVGITLPPDVDDRLARGEQLSLVVHQRTGDNISQEATGWLLVFLGEQYGITGTLPGGVVLDERDLADDEGANRDQFARSYAALAAFLALGSVTSVATILGGTRDRRGAEALLVLPVPRTSIAGGTAAGAWPLNAMQVTVGLLVLLFTALLPFPTLHQSWATVLGSLPATVFAAALLAAFGGGLGVVAGALGGGSSDSMGVGDLLAMPLAAVGIALLVAPELASSAGTLLVPGLGPLLLVRDAVLGEATLGAAALAFVGTAAGTLGLLYVAGRLLGGERNIRRT
jgi:hypothetical protein